MIDELENELEQEMDTPETWVNNRILVRDGKGRSVELEVPDDGEGEANA